MAWKNWPAWKKGGLIAVGILIIIEIIDLLILPAVLCPPPEPGLGCIFPSKIANTPLMLMPFFNNKLINLILVVIFYFAIGALIGWIIGKVRAKKEEAQK